MMGFKSLSLHNFLSHKNSKLPLANRGLVLIRGVVEGSNSTTSNGAGKSALLEALLFALTGKTLRAQPMIRLSHFGKGDAAVIVEGETKDDKYLLLRPIENERFSRIRVESHLAGSIVGAEPVARYIESSILGKTTFNSLLASIVFSDQGAFTKLSDDARKQIFEELLALEEISAAYDRNKSVLTALEAEKLKMQQEGQYLAGQLQAVSTFIETQQRAIAEFAQNRAKRLGLLHAELDNARQKSQELIAASSEALNAKAEAVVIHTAAIAILELGEKAQTDLREKISATLLEITSLKTKLLTHSEYSKKVGDLQGVCPTCEQEVDSGLRKSLLARHSTLVASLEQGIRKASTELQTLREEEARIKKRVDDGRREAQRVQADIHQHDARIKLCSANQTNITSIIADLNKRIAAEQADSSFEEAKKSLTTAEENKRDLQSKITLLELNQADLDDQLRVHQFWSEGFGLKGLKAWCVEEALPFINKRAAYYSDILTDGELSVRVLPTSKTLSGEERSRIRVEVTTRHATQEYILCSKGQRCRADIITTLAMGDYAAMRAPHPIKLAFFDELFDPIDEAGVERIMRVLADLSTTRESIFVISHSPHVQQYFSKQDLVVLNAQGESSLIVDAHT